MPLPKTASRKDVEARIKETTNEQRELVRAAERENRDLTVDEDDQFNALTRERRELETRSFWGEYPDDFHTPPGRTVPDDDPEEQLADRAFAGWARNAAGFPVRPEEQQACERFGIALNSSSFELQLNRYRDRPGRTLAPRALDVGSDGEIVPEGFVRSLEKALADFSGVLQAANIITTDDGADLPWPTANDLSNVGELLDEAAAIGATVDPTISAVILKAWKYSSKLVLVSSELLQDEAVQLASELGTMLGERLGRILNQHLTTGDNDGKPHGIVNAVGVGKTAAAEDAITPEELIDLQHSVDPAYRGGPSVGWMMHDKTAATIRKMKQDGRFIWQESLQQGQPARLLGFPVHFNVDMTDTLEADAKPVLFGDFSRYRVRIVRGVRARRLTERYADTDQEGFISFLRADGRLVDAGGGAIKALQMDDGE